jgi:hypothetical protein
LSRNSKRDNDTETFKKKNDTSDIINDASNNVTSTKFEILLFHAKLEKKKTAIPRHTNLTRNILNFVHYLWQKQKKQNGSSTEGNNEPDLSLFDVPLFEGKFFGVVHYYAITVVSH